MYAWLMVDTSTATPELRAIWYRSSTQDPPMLAPGELERKQAQLAAIVKTSYAGVNNAERERLRAAVLPMVRYITGDAASQNFAMHLALAHHRLSQAARSAREDLIERRIHEYFGDIAAMPARVTEGLAMLRLMALLVPDALLDMYLRTECGQHYRNLLLLGGSQKPPAPTPPGIVRLHELASLLTDGQPNPVLPALYIAYSVCTPLERDLFLALLASTHIVGCPGAFVAISAALDALPGQPEWSFKIGRLNQALAKVVANRQAPPEVAMPMADVIAAQVEQTVQQMARINGTLLVQAVIALRNGVPLGPRGDEGRETLAMLEQKVRSVDDLFTPDRVRIASQKAMSAPEPAPLQTAADTPEDLDPVHAWSVSRLLQWIEGPLATRVGSRPDRIDRKAIALREAKVSAERRLRAQAAAKGQPPQKGERPAQPRAFTAEDIDLAVQGALAATARFFIDDINELLPLATRLQAPIDDMDACHRLLEPMAHLLQPGVQDSDARALLGEAEAAIASLRQRIRVAQVSQQKQERFDARLASALAAEPLVLGKRHGGVIDCRMDAADWAWVAQSYHRRWLPHARSLSIDGQVVALPPDQALALYVTGSSLSHHLFDVSVHLWRRRPNRDGAPSESEALYPPMNEDDWYDTYLPCCVLHVPG